jgi:hypothetical protein
MKKVLAAVGLVAIAGAAFAFSGPKEVPLPKKKEDLKKVLGEAVGPDASAKVDSMTDPEINTLYKSVFLKQVQAGEGKDGQVSEAQKIMQKYGISKIALFPSNTP